MSSKPATLLVYVREKSGHSSGNCLMPLKSNTGEYLKQGKKDGNKKRSGAEIESGGGGGDGGNVVLRPHVYDPQNDASCYHSGASSPQGNGFTTAVLDDLTLLMVTATCQHSAPTTALRVAS